MVASHSSADGNGFHLVNNTLTDLGLERVGFQSETSANIFIIVTY